MWPHIASLSLCLLASQAHGLTAHVYLSEGVSALGMHPISNFGIEFLVNDANRNNFIESSEITVSRMNTFYSISKPFMDEIYVYHPYGVSFSESLSIPVLAEKYSGLGFLSTTLCRARYNSSSGIIGDFLDCGSYRPEFTILGGDYTWIVTPIPSTIALFAAFLGSMFGLRMLKKRTEARA